MTKVLKNIFSRNIRIEEYQKSASGQHREAIKKKLTA